VARAETYLTQNQVAGILFPNTPMGTHWTDVGQNTRVLWGPHREALFIDKVFGKHQLITYAVGINADGVIQGVEIMDYQETYGYEIRDKTWRQHFVGKTVQDPLRLDKDIPNISGATLSSKHVTDGVRRLLQLYETLKANH
jgi:Na+-translocating ferredoxin:NAD+ oxidoreductase RnfG subunit